MSDNTNKTFDVVIRVVADCEDTLTQEEVSEWLTERLNCNELGAVEVIGCWPVKVHE